MDTESRPSSQKRILIIEDDLALQAMLSQSLQSVGFETFSETQGDAAYRRVLELRPDLILLDVNLPGTKGTDVCRAVKSDPRTNGCFVLMMTGEFKSLEDKLKGFNLGADDYVVKPFDLMVLLGRVKSILSKKDR